MQITIAQLVAAGIPVTQARLYREPLELACAAFAIDTPARVAAFVAQCAHESSNFSQVEEGLFYRTPERIRAMWPRRVPSLADAARLTRNPRGLANTVYAGRNGNGDTASGDGWRYRGRGLIQLTGRANYAAAEQATGRPYTAEPDLVAQPADACLTAAWFWSANGCNALADGSQIDAITRVINGPALVGLTDRRENFREALLAFAPQSVTEA